MSLTILTGDCVDQCRKYIADESIDLCVTSPPYDKLRDYNSCNWNFEELALELFRVIKPGGVVCWNVGDSIIKKSETLTAFRQAIFFKDTAGFCVHDTMIWNKLNFANPETVRYHQVFEYVFVLSKGSPKTFNPIKDKPNATAGRIGCLGKNTFAKRDGSRSERAMTYITTDFGMRGNVWRGPTRGQEEFCKELPHPAMMPKWLARDLILSWSNPGDTVLDPMAGSFTTCQQALECGRKAIGIEVSEEYILLGQNISTTIGLPL